MQKLSYTDMLAMLGIGGAHPGSLALTKKIVENLQINENMKVLDLGCGTGQTAAYLAKQYNCNVSAVDSHPQMIEKAKKRFAKEKVDVDLSLASIERLPFHDHVYDLILCESVMAFTNINDTLLEVVRVLKQSGKFILSEMVLENDIIETEKEEISTFYKFKQMLYANEWYERLRQVGFSNVTVNNDIHTFTKDVYDIDHDPSPQIDPEVFQILEKHNQLHKKFKNKLGYSLFICSK